MHRLPLLAAALLAVSACVPNAAPYHLVAPADPSIRVRGPAYSTVMAGTKRFEVTGPGDWRELNRQAAPGTEGDDNRGDDTATRARRGR